MKVIGVEKVKRIKSNWIIKLMKNETISYLVFGVMTTIVNYSIFVAGLSLTNEEHILTVNIIAFLGATLFAYITNKLFVFHSLGWTIRQLIWEFGKFAGARVFSLGVEQVGLYVATKNFHVEKYSLLFMNAVIVVKVVLSFVSVLLNYFASKFIVFKRRKGNESTDDCSGV